MKINQISFIAFFLSIVIAWAHQLCSMNTDEKQKQLILQQNEMLRNTYVKDAYIDLAHPDLVTKVSEWLTVTERLAQKAKGPDFDENGFERCDYQALEIAIHSKLDEINRHNSLMHRLWRTITFNKKPLDAKVVVPLSQLLVYNTLNNNHRSNGAICIDNQYFNGDSLNKLKEKIITSYLPQAQIKYSAQSSTKSNDNAISYKLEGNQSIYLPNTYCKGIVDFDAHKKEIEMHEFCDLSPREEKTVLPAVQYYPESGNLKSDVTSTITNIPATSVTQFDLSDSYFAGHEEAKNTLSVYALSLAAKRYITSAEGATFRLDEYKKDTRTHAEWRQSFGKDTVLDALSLCQKSNSLIYSTHSTTGNTGTSVITYANIATKPLTLFAKIWAFLSWQQRTLENQKSWCIPGEIKKIVEVDAKNFVCLTKSGCLYRINKDNTDKPIQIGVTEKYDDIAIDPETLLCALKVKDKGIRATNKKIFTVPGEWPSLQSADQITTDSEEAKHVKLQCHKGHIIAWDYTEEQNKSAVTFGDGQIREVPTDTKIKYSGVKLFKTQYSQP